MSESDHSAEALEARWHQQLAEIPEQAWDALVASAGLPFYRWAWLEALERSGSIVPSQGWQACHLSLWREQQLIAVAPLYVKGHSYGEFVFDQSFAQLAGQLGLRYYPKLLGMSPLSPILGYRFFIASNEEGGRLHRVDAALDRSLLRAQPTVELQLPLCRSGLAAPRRSRWLLPWLNQQSLWSNPGYGSFEDYLASFNANQRRNIRRERKAVQQAGLQVSAIAAEAITPELLAHMHGFYEDHCRRWGMWGSKYLTEEFFSLAQQLRQHWCCSVPIAWGRIPISPSP